MLKQRLMGIHIPFPVYFIPRDVPIFEKMLSILPPSTDMHTKGNVDLSVLMQGTYHLRVDAPEPAPHSSESSPALHMHFHGTHEANPILLVVHYDTYGAVPVSITFLMPLISVLNLFCIHFLSSSVVHALLQILGGCWSWRKCAGYCHESGSAIILSLSWISNATEVLLVIKLFNHCRHMMICKYIFFCFLGSLSPPFVSELLFRL